MLVTTGSTARRARISASISVFGRPSWASSTSISDECTPSACSSSSARPVRRPTSTTSGTSRINCSAIRPIALAFRQRYAGVEEHADRQRAFVERGQKRAWQLRGETACCDHGRQNSCDQQASDARTTTQAICDCRASGPGRPCLHAHPVVSDPAACNRPSPASA